MITRQDQLSLLDNPIWCALSTTHASFAEGDALAKRYPVDIAPFAATRDQSAESYDLLGQLIRPGEIAVLASVAVRDFPSGWTIVRLANSPQMVWNGLEPPPVKHSVVDLDSSHIDEMLALTELTRPGPFGKRTPELGSYIGIHEAGQLVAMAGERIRLPGYTEISAVCTHPDHRGRGYASSLVSALIQRITRRNETLFLHVRTENVEAIRVYDKLGFKIRRNLNFRVVKRE